MLMYNLRLMFTGALLSGGAFKIQQHSNTTLATKSMKMEKQKIEDELLHCR